MATFHFLAVRQGGQEAFSGDREAPDKQSLIGKLREEGAIAISVEPVRGGISLNQRLDLGFGGGVPQQEKVAFARNLSAMIAAGLTISRALEVIGRQSRSAAMREVVDGLREDVRQGSAFAEALGKRAKIFPPVFVAMVRAGEESGGLSQALGAVAVQLEKSYQTGRRVRGALIYPALVIAVMCGVAVLMLTYVLPTLSSTFEALHAQLPLLTRVFLTASDFLSKNFLPALAALVAVIALVLAAARTQPGKRFIDRALTVLPVFRRITAEVNAARTARTLSALLSSGVEALNALDITAEVLQNTVYRAVVREAKAAVEKGSPLSGAFTGNRVYPPMFSEMVAVGEETGALPGMLLRVADFYENEVEEDTKNISAIIEPALMVIVGMAVGLFAVAMIAPIYSLSNSI